jgi:succinoglycan biosynthesis transport protein ExoP
MAPLDLKPTSLTAVHPTSPAGSDVSVSDVLGALRRRWTWPLLGCLAGLGAALTFIAVSPVPYKATTRLLIDRAVNRYLQTAKVVDEPTIEDAETSSQMHVLASESVLVPVVRSLELTKDREFVGAAAAERSESAWLPSPGIVIRRLIGRPDVPAATADRLERVAVEELIKIVKVERADVPSVIDVTVTSLDAQKAADIANAIADTYLAANQDLKTRSRQLAVQVLTERLGELRKQLDQADQKAVAFRTENGLQSASRAADAVSQAGILSTQLSLSRAAAAEAKAKVELSQQRLIGNTAAPATTDNEVILRLRAQYLEVSARMADVATRVGPDHVALLTLRRRMQELEAVIKEEQRRVAASYVEDLRLATARSEEIATALTDLTGTSSGESAATRTRLRDLELAAESLRAAYNGVLQRLAEVNKTDEAVAQDARVISKAAAPLRKNQRKAILALVGGVAAGLLGGIVLALARELATGGVRTAAQMRRITGAYTTILPLTAPAPGSFGAAALDRLVLDAPFARFTEGFRNMRAVLLARRHPERGDVVCVTSAVAKEGKSTVAANLAALIASNATLRVLIIDTDLHRRSLSQRLVPSAKTGLMEALAAPSRLADHVTRRARTNVDVLPCVLTKRPANAAELVGSAEMEALLAVAASTYDFIILEAPPIASVADAKMIEPFVDHVILVVEWGVTTVSLVEEALGEVEGLGAKLACVALNKVDPKALHIIEAHKGPRFGAYYES